MDELMVQKVFLAVGMLLITLFPAALTFRSFAALRWYGLQNYSTV